MVRDGIGDGRIAIESDHAQIENGRRAHTDINGVPEITKGLPERPVLAQEDLNDGKGHDNQADEQISTRQRCHVVIRR